MTESKWGVFDVVLLVVGVSVSLLGFQLINKLYIFEGHKLNWMMILAIFTWLILLILVVMLSLIVDMSRKQFAELKNLIFLLSSDKKKK